MMSESNYTKEQLQVIEHDGGHAVVAAVAGSGKTETLVGRLRHLLRTHNSNQIAVVMFNRDARESFQRRFQKAVRTPPPDIRTFNSMGNKIVNYLVQQGVLPDAKIVEHEFRRTKIAREAFTQVFKSLNGDDLAPDKELVDGFVSFLLLVKADIHSPETVFESGSYGRDAEGYPQAFHIYEEQRQRLKIRFFEDQIYDPVKLLLRNQGLQKLVTNRVDHLIVDEAQDVNGIQIALLRILAGTRAKVMLVGDEDQAIYEWRGAKPDYLTRGFEKDFSGAARYTLPHTFRFGHTLSLAASYAIANNRNRNPKISISAENTPRTRINCLPLSLGLTGIADHIRDVVADGAAPDDVAVLVRTYSMSVSLELELNHMGIPYFVYGRPPLNRIPEISALVGVLQLASGRWRRLASGEIKFTLNSLLQRPGLYLDRIAINGIVDQVMAQPDRISDAIRSVITPQTKGFHADQIRDRADLLEIIATGTESGERVIDVINRYIQGTNFEKSVEKQAPTADQAQMVLANVEAFRRIAASHEGTIEEFLDELDPLIDSSKVDPPKDPHVWIGSIHRAKGAQWPVVFVPGLATSSFPRDHISEQELEAERRLFYVAITRATDHLFLVHPQDNDFKDVSEKPDSPKSRPLSSPVSIFMWEAQIGLSKHAGEAVERECGFTKVDVVSPDIANQYFQRFPFASDWAYGKVQPKVYAANSISQVVQGDLKPGTRVSHSDFGVGTVERWIDQRVIRVKFDSGDSRMLVYSRAALSLLGVSVVPNLSLVDDLLDSDIPF